MEQEKIINKNTSYSVSISGGRVDSLRGNEDLKTVVRVYEDGKIGIAGRIGEGDDNELIEGAKAQLAQNIPYPCNLTEGGKREVTVKTDLIPADKIVKSVNELLDRLNKAYPEFIFSNKVEMRNFERTYENSKNTHYRYESGMALVVLVIKDKKSANIMDLSYGTARVMFDADAIVEDIGKLLNVYHKKLELPKEEVPVIVNVEVLQYALFHLSAEKYMSGSSLFNGKLNQKVFDEKVNLYADFLPETDNFTCFFDSEGTTLKGDKFHFVKDGVLCGLATCKRSAANFNLPLSGGGYAEFDEVPQGSFFGFEVGTTAKSIKDVVKGKAIFVAITSGGDMTPDGTIGLPVQLAYLYEDGKLLGALPEFGISANVFDILGKDFLGIARNDIFSFVDEKVLVAKFKINK